MAGSGDVSMSDVVDKFKEMNLKAIGRSDKDPNQMTNKAFFPTASSRLTTNVTCKGILDASVWAKHTKDNKKNLDLTKMDVVNAFMTDIAVELQKNDTKYKGKSVEEIKQSAMNKICDKAPITKGTKTSKTGNVAGMTDASKYTGAHKERFDESGKGKGVDGREDRADNSGYVGNYKGEGTYKK